MNAVLEHTRARAHTTWFTWFGMEKKKVKTIKWNIIRIHECEIDANHNGGNMSLDAVTREEKYDSSATQHNERINKMPEWTDRSDNGQPNGRLFI